MILETDEGAVVVPRKVTLSVACGVLFVLFTQVVIYVTDRESNKHSITAINTWIGEAKGRGDDIRRRIMSLEADRDRLIRVEERLKTLDDRLVEIRDELRNNRSR